MFLFVDIALLILALGLLVPIAVLFIECSAALLPPRNQSQLKSVPRPKLAVLVPAHNEAQIIGATLETILPQLTEQDRLVVVADNCTDETADIAKRYCNREMPVLAQFGGTQELAPSQSAVNVSVVERHDAERKGKGYALDYGLRFIEKDAPDVVVMIDADCIVHQGAIEQIACLAASINRPVQATYLMEQPANPRPKDLVSGLAFMVKNFVRPRGLTRLQLPCLLTGTGMAFPWPVVANASLASSNIVEDMQFSVDLVLTGQTPVFCSNAKFTGRLPQQEQAAKSQRTRWEHGHLQTLKTQVPQLFKAAVHQKRFDLLALALEVLVPPVSLLVMIWIALMAGALLAGVLGTSWIPALVLVVEGILIFVSIVGVWAKFGRADFPLLTLLAIPFYILWKIPLYLAFLIKPQTKWIRTERDTIDVSKP